MTRLRIPHFSPIAVVLIGMLSAVPVWAHEGEDHGKPDEAKIAKSLAALPVADREAAENQRFCPMMMRTRLGASGKPIKVMVGSNAVFVCCKGCIDEVKEQPKEAVQAAKKLRRATANLAKLSAEDRRAAEAQKFCAVNTDSMLGLMGSPVKIDVGGKSVFLCCGGCKRKAMANPKETLANAEKLRKGDSHKGHGHQHGHKHGHKH